MAAETEPVSSIEDVRRQMQCILDFSRPTIGKLRTYVQNLADGVNDGQAELVEEIEAGFKNLKAKETEGHLYRISDDADTQAEEPGGFTTEISRPAVIEEDEGDAELQGLFVYFVLQGIGYEFFILDSDIDRRLWDKKSPGKRQWFARRHTERMQERFPKGLYDSDELPLDYFFIASDIETRYRIDQIMPYNRKVPQ